MARPSLDTFRQGGILGNRARSVAECFADELADYFESLPY